MTKNITFNRLAILKYHLMVFLTSLLFTTHLQAQPAAYRIMYSFNGPTNDGMWPVASMTLGPMVPGIGGPVYGTTTFGGTGYDGLIFSISPNGNSNSFAFSAVTNPFNYKIIQNVDNSLGHPLSRLVLANASPIEPIFYGTLHGNFGQYGFVVGLSYYTPSPATVHNPPEITDGFVPPSGFADNLSVLYAFSSVGPTDGFLPYGDLDLENNNILIGTTSAGGDFNEGIIYRLNTDGSGYTIIHEFDDATNGDGSRPTAGTVRVSAVDISTNWLLMGTTSTGGSADDGVIYSTYSDGSSYQIIHTFGDGSYMDDGTSPRDTMINVHDEAFTTNALFGTTFYGGAGAGTIFGILPGVGYTILHRFDGGTEGNNPVGALTYFKGALYGATYTSSAPNNYGTVYKMDSNGSNFVVLHTFAGPPFDGANPAGGLVLYTNLSGAWLLGTTYTGGPGNFGTVFELPLELYTNSGPKIIEPVDGAVLPDTTNIVISVSATNIMGTDQVSFYGDYVLLGVVTNTSGTFTFTWTNPPAGQDVISVSANHTNGTPISFSEVHVTSFAVYPNEIVDFAGKQVYSYHEAPRPATNTFIESPYSMAIDGSGNVYIADASVCVIWKVDASGLLSAVAGSYVSGYSGDGAAATNATLSYPQGIAVDGSGNLYIADTENNVIRKIDTSGTITTVAGDSALGGGYSGDGGPAVDAALFFPTGIAVDSSGNLYISDSYNNVIRKVDTSGTITTIVGASIDGGYGGDGGPATNALVILPEGIALDGSGNLYFADNGNNLVRKVDANGTITTVAGCQFQDYFGDGGPATNAALFNPFGIAVDSTGDIYIADSGNNVIRKVIDGYIFTAVGNYALGPGYAVNGGSVTNATLRMPLGVSLDSSNRLYIADTQNYTVRFCPN